MEWGNLRTWLGKYKYALLVLGAGLCLMMLPEQEAKPAQEATPITPISMEQMLEEILSQVDGAGKVRVLLSEASGSQRIYQTDGQEDGEKVERKTVVITDSQNNEEGLLMREDPPKYLGAVVVCQGADSAQVRLAIVDAVRCATGLGSNQISVVKMK